MEELHKNPEVFALRNVLRSAELHHIVEESEKQVLCRLCFPKLPQQTDFGSKWKEKLKQWHWSKEKEEKALDNLERMTLYDEWRFRNTPALV